MMQTGSGYGTPELSGCFASTLWQDTRLPQRTHRENTNARNSARGRFFGPEKIFFRRSSVSFADLDRGVEKGM